MSVEGRAVAVHPRILTSEVAHTRHAVGLGYSAAFLALELLEVAPHSVKKLIVTLHHPFTIGIVVLKQSFAKFSEGASR